MTDSNQTAGETSEPRREPGFWRRTLLGHSWIGAPIYGALSGLLLALSFPPFGLWPLAFVALIPWMNALGRVGWGTAFLTAFTFGCTFLGIGIGWLSLLSVAAVAAVLPILSLHLAVFALFSRVFLQRNRWWSPAGVAAAWIGVESFRVFLDAPLPFPWMVVGNAAVPFHPLVQIADLGGALLVSFVVVYVNAALVAPMITPRAGQTENAGRRRRVWLAPVGAAVLVAASVGYGSFRLAQFAEENAVFEGPAITIVQPNYEFRGQGMLYPSRLPRNMTLTRAALHDAEPDMQPDMVLWFEAVYSGLRGASNEQSLYELTRRQWQDFRSERGDAINRFRPNSPDWKPDAWPYLVIGTAFPTDQRVPGREQNYGRSSAHLVAPDGQTLASYDKQDLVPMGEYVPYYELGFVRDLVTSGFSSQGFRYIPATRPGDGPVRMMMDPSATGGTTVDNPYREDGQYEFGAPICYELVFPDTIRSLARSSDETGRPADFLVNISDEGWYQTTPELEQMLQAGVMRAIENRRSIVRGTNTGISGFISPTGELHDMIEDEDGNRAEVGPTWKTARVQVTAANSVYREIGDWPPVLAGLLVLWLTIWTTRLRRREKAAAAATGGPSTEEPVAETEPGA